jgi:hypothetical protein
MKTWNAIFFSIGLLAASITIYAVTGFDPSWFMVLGTSIWAAIDSSKIQLKHYRSGISYGPFVVFLLCAMIWIVGFPWYLAMRYKIKHGTAILKDEYSRVPATATPGPGQENCAECGGAFNTDEMIHHGYVFVCAACKPRFLQKIAEGAGGKP